MMAPGLTALGSAGATGAGDAASAPDACSAGGGVDDAQATTERTRRPGAVRKFMGADITPLPRLVFAAPAARCKAAVWWGFSGGAGWRPRPSSWSRDWEPAGGRRVTGRAMLRAT